MSRITSQDGNVIAADFRRPQIKIEFDTHILYADAAVCLIRIVYRMNNEIVGIQHVTAEQS